MLAAPRIFRSHSIFRQDNHSIFFFLYLRFVHLNRTVYHKHFSSIITPSYDNDSPYISAHCLTTLRHYCSCTVDTRSRPRQPKTQAQVAVVPEQLSAPLSVMVAKGSANLGRGTWLHDQGAILLAEAWQRLLQILLDWAMASPGLSESRLYRTKLGPGPLVPTL